MATPWQRPWTLRPQRTFFAEALDHCCGDPLLDGLPCKSTRLALVQCPDSWIPPKSIGEGASSLFEGRPGSPENVSCSGATPHLQLQPWGWSRARDIFGTPGPSSEKTTAPSPIDLGGIQEFGHCTRPVGSQGKTSKRGLSKFALQLRLVESIRSSFPF